MQTELNEDWYTEMGRGKIERGRGKITGRKGRKKKIELHLWDSNPQPLAYMTRALPLVLRGSLKLYDFHLLVAEIHSWTDSISFLR